MDDRYVIAMDWIEGTDLEALLDARRPPRARPGARDRLSRTGRRGAGAPSHSRPARRARRRQAGQPDPHLLRPDRPRRLRTVLHANRRPAPGGYGRLRGTRGRGGGETDRGVGRVLARRHRRGAAHRRGSLRGRAELGRDRARADPGAGADPAPEPGHRSGASRCIGGRLRRQAAAMVGRRPPEGNGHARAGRRERHGRAERGGFGERGRRCASGPLRRTRRRRAADGGVRVGPGRLRRRPRARGRDSTRGSQQSRGRRSPRAGTLPGRVGIRGGPAPEDGRSGTGRDRRLDCRDDRRLGFRRRSASPRYATASPTSRRRGRSSRPVCRSRHAPTRAPTAG